MTQTAIRPQFRGLPGRLREDGYDLPDGLSYDEWWQIGQTLQQMERSVQWWLGDWWNYGQPRYGELASQATRDAIKDATGHTYRSIQNASYVAKEFQNARRRANLSWSHHEAVKGLSEEDADALLDAAESEGLSVFDTRDRVRDRKRAVAGTVLGAESAPLPMSADDLTADARQAMTYHANGMPTKHRAAFERGFVQALIWTEARDCFTRWEL